MKGIKIYTEKEFEKYKGIAYGLKRITDEKLSRTLPKGLCYWCEEEKAKYPKSEPILCASCFVTIVTNKLEKVEKFGSEEMDLSLSNEQKEKNKKRAKEILKKIYYDPEKFADKDEQEILKILKREAEPFNFFENN